VAKYGLKAVLHLQSMLEVEGGLKRLVSLSLFVQDGFESSQFYSAYLYVLNQ